MVDLIWFFVCGQKEATTKHLNKRVPRRLQYGSPHIGNIRVRGWLRGRGSVDLLVRTLAKVCAAGGQMACWCVLVRWFRPATSSECGFDHGFGVWTIGVTASEVRCSRLRSVASVVLL